mmetsp:Transcript_35807/g.86988  ORF Transcript_35807/g.86988 Transcript_35807/m.86988 type:complete len:99 (+) Transcript_35807:455-751(+)
MSGRVFELPLPLRCIVLAHCALVEMARRVSNRLQELLAELVVAVSICRDAAGRCELTRCRSFAKRLTESLFTPTSLAMLSSVHILSISRSSLRVIGVS